MNPVLRSIYRPGTSLLHRASPGLKIAGLAVMGLATALFSGWVSGIAFLVLAGALALIGGVGIRQLGSLLRSFVIFGTLIFALQVWQNSVDRAVELVAELLALVIAATTLTATTPIDDMIDTIVVWLGPFRRVGVNPQAVGFAFALAIRSLPQTMELASETRAAAKARGLDRSTRAFAIPFVIRVVAHARDTGAALHARGIGDD